MATEVNIMMTNDRQDTQLTKTNTQTLGIGARLKKAREEMQLSEKDAAARLHLSPRFIDLMEKEDFNSGTPVTFIRGYMRSYAKLLHIPEHEVDTALNQLGISIAPSTALTSTHLNNISLSSNSERYVRWITYLITLLLLVLVGIWWNSHTREKTNSGLTPPVVVTSPKTATAPSSAPAINTNNTNSTSVTGAPTTTDGFSAMPSEQPTDLDTTSATSNIGTSPPTGAPGNPAPPVQSVVTPPGPAAQSIQKQDSAASGDTTATDTTPPASTNKPPVLNANPVTVENPAATSDTTTINPTDQNEVKENPAPKTKQHQIKQPHYEEQDAPLMAVPEPGLETN